MSAMPGPRCWTRIHRLFPVSVTVVTALPVRVPCWDVVAISSPWLREVGADEARPPHGPAVGGEEHEQVDVERAGGQRRSGTARPLHGRRPGDRAAAGAVLGEDQRPRARGGRRGTGE